MSGDLPSGEMHPGNGSDSTSGPDVRFAEVTAERFVAGGRALARHPDGRIVLVRGALPGERVLVELTGRRGGAEIADVRDVLDESSDRVEPPCPRRIEGCGGCDWQHLAVGAQIAAKVAVVDDALRRTARLPDAVVVAGGSVPADGARTTIRVVGMADGGVGYRREESHDLVDADGCLIAHPALRELLTGLRVPQGLEVSLRCSAATGELTAVWDGPIDAVEAEGVGVGPTARLTETIVHGPTARDSPERDSPGRDSPGRDSPGERTTTLAVSAASFFQSGPAAAGLLIDAVARAAPELATARTVVDLYGGVGLFAASVAPRSARVVVVESSRSAVADARVNLADREQVTIVRADVGRWDARRSGVQQADVVVADPPRAGLGRRGVGALAACGATTVVLVSCDPVAAARDAALLAEQGYRHERAEVLDLFPWTHHVETVTRYVRDAGAR